MTDRGAFVYEVLRSVRPIILSSTRVVEAQVRELGWTVGARAVMEVLYAEAPLTVPQVAVRLSLARQNVQRLVDELIRLDHVKTSPNPAHRRSVLVQPTVKGRAAFRDLHDRELTQLAQMALACTDEDLETAARVLRALDRAIQARATAATGSIEE